MATNNIPTGTNDPLIPLNINQIFTFAPAAFGFSDLDSGDTLQKVQITTLPLAGSLTLNNGTTDVAVTLNQEILVADILANKLKFTPANNATGIAYATIGFKVSDGKDYSASANTLTFNVTNLGFENDFTNWTINDTVIGTGGNYIAGPNVWAVNPSGTKMAVLTPAGSSGEKIDVYTALAVGNVGQTYLDTQFPNPTNYSYVYTDLTLAANQKISMAWNQVATDYAPFNDASWVSFVNQTTPSDTSMLIKVGDYGNLSGQVAILGATALGTGNYVTGDYGSTGWQTLSLTAGAAGTYRLGFAVFNLSDTLYNPHLFIDQHIGTTLKNTVPFNAVEVPIIAPTNNAPTLTQFSSAVANGNEDSVIQVTFGDLINYGNEADSTGSVTSFVVKTVTTGTLKIGTDSISATPFVAGTNDTIDATHNAYWTPTLSANGTLNAFAVIAKDDSGSESTIPVQTTISVNPVNSSPILTIPYLNQGIAYGKPWNFSLANHFTDPDSSALVYSATNLPAWLSVSGDTLVGIPPSKTLNQTFSVNITANDGALSSSPANFSVTVLDFDAGNLFLGTTGNETISGTSGIDTITYAASQAGLSLTLPTNFENIIGSNHNDTLNDSSSINNSILEGGFGNDVYVISNSTTQLFENLNGGIDEVQSGVDYDLSKIQNVEKLTLTGSAIKARGANKNELLVGNSANNILDGRASADTMEGGAGNDTYYVDNIGDVVIENANSDTDTVISSITSSSGYMLPPNVENLTLIGKSSRSVMQGTGNELNNIITASAGGGTLKGLDGNDTLIGSNGNDKLVGGLGADSLQGGMGKNVYIYKSAAESNANSFDHIVGAFNGGAADKIQLATTLLAGDLNIISAQSAGVTRAGLTVAALNTLLSETSATKFQSTKLNVAVLTTTDTSPETFLAIDIDGDGAFTSGDMLIDMTGSTLTSVTNSTFKVSVLTPNAPSFTFATVANYGMTQTVTSSSSIVTVSGLDAGATWKYSLKNGAYITGTGTSFELPPATYAVHDIRVVQTNSTGVDSLDAFNLQPILATIDQVIVTAANATPYDVSTTAAHFQMMAVGTYTYNISGFGTGDSINFHYGSTPTLTLTNSSASDGIVDLTYTLNSYTITAHLTGLTTAQDGAITDLTSFRTVFGANSVTANNIAPVLNNFASTPISFTEDSTPVILNSLATVDDAELAALGGGFGNYVGATLTLQRQGTANVDDVFDFAPNSGFSLGNGGIVYGVDYTIMGTYTQTGGVLSITFTIDSFYNQSYAEQSRINNLLSAITYSNSSNTPPASVQIDWTFNDGVGQVNSSVTRSTTVNITAVNDVPTANALSVASGSVITSSGDLTTTRPTLEADVYWDGTGVNPLLIYNGNPSSSGYGLLGINNNGTMEIHLLIGGKQVVPTVLGTIQANSWSHMGVSLATDNTTYNYAIGSTVGYMTSLAPNVQDSTIRFGGINSDSFSGQVDNIAVWNTQFTGAQIQSHSSGLIGNETNLAGLWKFENDLANSVVGGHAFAATGSTSLASTFAISGIAMKNQTLTVNSSSISDADGLGAFTYHWKKTISGVTSDINVPTTQSSLPLTNAEVGAQISVVVTYTDGGGTLETLTTLPTSIVQPTTVAVTAANVTPYDASTDNIVFNFTSSTSDYTYNIAGFGSGDVLNFPDNATATIINDVLNDNSVNVEWADNLNGNIITVTLTGLTNDVALYSMESFKTAFGAGSLI